MSELPICACDALYPGQGHPPDCPVRVEIERLRAEKASLCEAMNEASRKIQVQRAEIERLRAQVEILASGLRRILHPAPTHANPGPMYLANKALRDAGMEE